MNFTAGIISVFALCMWAVSSAFAGPSTTVRDWNVWCDAELSCTLHTYKTELYGFGFQRSPKAGSEPVLYFSMQWKPKHGSEIIAVFDGDEARAISIPVGAGKLEEGTWHFPGQNKDYRLIDAMMAGNTMVLRIETNEGPKQLKVSLSGITAAALFADEAQQRLGNQDALKDKGDGEPKDVETRVTKLGSRADLPPEVLDFWNNKTNDCGLGYGENDDLISSFGGLSVDVADDAQLFLLPCGPPGAYNLSQVVLIYNLEGKEVKAAPFPIMGNKGPSVIDYAINADWDDATSTLSAFYKGRGLGDCGIRTVWHWEGGYYSNFELLEEFRKDDCDGEYEDWPQVWPVK